VAVELEASGKNVPRQHLAVQLRLLGQKSEGCEAHMLIVAGHGARGEVHKQ
jgi:hypothetical protein